MEILILIENLEITNYMHIKMQRKSSDIGVLQVRIFTKSSESTIKHQSYLAEMTYSSKLNIFMVHIFLSC
jgi:hypothetical protein